MRLFDVNTVLSATETTSMTSPNGLICFTNCLIPLEDGSLVKKDLWIDERRGVVLDSQVSGISTMKPPRGSDRRRHSLSQHTFYHRKERPRRIIDLGGNIIRYTALRPLVDTRTLHHAADGLPPL